MILTEEESTTNLTSAEIRPSRLTHDVNPPFLSCYLFHVTALKHRMGSKLKNQDS
jgi:hypothetical protein